MNHSNTGNPQQSNVSPVMLQLAEKRAELEVRQQELQQASPQQEPEIDPLEAARVESPLLQYLDSTKDLKASTLPDAQIKPLPPVLKLGQFRDRDEWEERLQLAIAQIKALGFGIGDTVALRLIAPKNLPEKYFQNWTLLRGKSYDLEILPNDKYRLVPYKKVKVGVNDKGEPIKEQVRDEANATLNWGNTLLRENCQGYGMYLLPNKGGHKDADITHTMNAFYEVDDKSFEQQQAQLNDFTSKTGLKPSVVVRTRKSLHVYFRFKKSEWQLPDWTNEVQKPTTLALQSDVSITNLARPMRLAGFFHVKYEKVTDSFLYQKCDLLVCEPENQYTRAEYRKALATYSGQEYSAKRLDTYNTIFKAKAQPYIVQDEDYKLLPSVQQVLNCPGDLIAELARRIEVYMALLQKEYNVQDVDPVDAWVKPLDELKTHKTYDLENVDTGRTNDILRWAQYLVGYNENGRPGWITGQDPTILESESDNHSPDSLHINKETGAFKCHRNDDNTAIRKALKELAFRSNPEEERIYKEKWARILAEARKEEGQITAEEYQQRKLKPELTETEKLDKVIDLQQAQAAKDERIEREFAEYQARLAIDKSKLHKYYQCSERYLSDSTFAEFPSLQECKTKGQMLGLKSAKGTGKSKRFKELIKLAVDEKWHVISVTPRVNLGVAQASEWGLPWISEDGIEVFTEDKGNAMSCCWDSLYKLYRKDYRDKPILLVIDEIESGLEHLATSGTFKGKGTRAAVYNQLRRILDHIQKHGGLIIGADADLSQISLGFVQTLNPRLPITVVENTYVIPKKEIKVFFNKDGNVKAEILQEIEDLNPFICACDSKDDVKDLYDHAMKHVRPDVKEKYWAIHAENVNDEANQKRIKDFNGQLKVEQPLGVFFSPTITVGISIDLEYFRTGYGNFKGSVTADVARQMTARNREIIPWVIFADNLCDRKGDDTPTTPEDVKAKFVSQIKEQATLTQWMTEKLLKEDQEKFGSDIEELEAQIRLIKTLTEDTRSMETAEFHLLGDVLAKQNFQKKYFHKCFVKGMESEGWIVESKRGEKTGASEELKEAREERHKKESEEIAAADHSHIASPDIAKDILSTSSKREERTPAEKVVLADKAFLDPDELDAETVEALKFNRRLLPGIRLQWYLLNFGVALRSDARRMMKLIKDIVEIEIGSPQDATGVSVWLNEVIRLGVFDIIDLDDDERDYKKEDFQPLIDKIKFYDNEALENWAKKIGINWKAKKHSRDGILKNPVGRVIKPILEKLGYDFIQAKKNGKGQNSYKIPAEQINDLLRAKVLSGMDKNEAEKQAQRELEQTELSNCLLNQDPDSSVKMLAFNEQVTA